MVIHAQSSPVRLSALCSPPRSLAVRRTLGAAVLALGLLTAPSRVVTAQTGSHSALWGQQGEAWTPSSRLPDFSFAGYHAGNRAIPTVAVTTNVKDFGATGNGTTDDTAAFKRAIAATTNGALYIPAGQYKITDVLDITKSHVVLRGAGKGQTTLLMARSLREITGAVPYGTAALINVRGGQQGQQLTGVVAAARRGERTLVVASTAGITAGQMIRLRLHNPADNSLGCYLYANQGCLNAERRAWYGGKIVDWAVEVQAVRGNTVTLVRPLRVDVRPEWAPSLWQHRPTVQEVGIEQLTIAFPNVQYGGHDHWAGYYALNFFGVVNSWVRQVTITDADRGIEFKASGYNTVTHVTLNAHWRTRVPNPSGGMSTGHYGFAMSAFAQDNLVTESDIQTRFDHNMSVTSFANGNVFAGIESKSGGLDHHGAAPYENLFTEIVLTETAANLLASGGNRADEPNAGARTTLWNVLSLHGPFGNYVPTRFPQMNLIGLDQWTTTKTPERAWIERWLGPLTGPANLYQAQLQRRQGGAADTDGDALADAQERTVYHTDPTRTDTDSDGISDGTEVAMWGDAWGTDADGDGLSNLLDADADNDGVLDGAERQQGTDPGHVHLWLEAETAAFTAPLVVATDVQASGGQYLWAPESTGHFVRRPTAAGGEALYHFTVPATGTYVIWGRVLAPGSSADSFFVAVDTAPLAIWDLVQSTGGTWGWDAVSYRTGLTPEPSAPAMRLPLTAGPHTLRLKQRENGTKLDRLLVTNDLTFVPR
jgi:Pectate lyase superfamily protein/Bacterial TSP3 repeat